MVFVCTEAGGVEKHLFDSMTSLFRRTRLHWQNRSRNGHLLPAHPPTLDTTTTAVVLSRGTSRPLAASPGTSEHWLRGAACIWPTGLLSRDWLLSPNATSFSARFLQRWARGQAPKVRAPTCHLPSSP